MFNVDKFQSFLSSFFFFAYRELRKFFMNFMGREKFSSLFALIRIAKKFLSVFVIGIVSGWCS